MANSTANPNPPSTRGELIEFNRSYQPTRKQSSPPAPRALSPAHQNDKAELYLRGATRTINSYLKIREIYRNMDVEDKHFDEIESAYHKFEEHIRRTARNFVYMVEELTGSEISFE